ncbi:hypothetical protein [Lysinibacillus sphaericus]|uniref:hypothetical protein n=1 Tax=Lysinibacillus sphaericus TaxID=1421 RepID=UPI0018CFE68F|nr:hypothetical protein [Lysinibacillus sphaericus]MBG9479384.1 hypothetical protein [Lysinibacillus sphaericus]MBG9479433.1 hypothetical protein [Lysinibacillus sphaericus]
MYKKIVLKKFEKGISCRLSDDQFEDVKKELENTISILNKGIEEGNDYLDSYMQSYDRELSGMRSICSIIGISLEVKKEKN